MEFLLMNLGSSIFWIVFILFYAICGTISMKLIAKDTYSYLVGGKSLDDFNSGRFNEIDPAEIFSIVIFNYLFWHVFLICWIVVILVNLFFLLIRKLIVVLDKLIPDIKIEKKKKQKNNDDKKPNWTI